MKINYHKEITLGLSESCESLVFHFSLGPFEPWIWRQYVISKRRVRTTEWNGVIFQKIGNLPKNHWLEIYTNLSPCPSHICMWKRLLLLVWNQTRFSFWEEKLWGKALSGTRVPRHMGTLVLLFHVFLPIIRILKVIIYTHVYVLKDESTYYPF